MASKIKHHIIASIGPSYGPWLVFLISLGVYLRTVAPTIGPIDSGELAIVCKTLGIAHPTGYPLYTLLGRLWVWLVPFGQLAWKLNLLSSLLMAFSAMFVFRILAALKMPDPVPFSVSLLYAFSPVIWQQAVFLEVYALTAMIAPLLIWLAVRYCQTGDNRTFLLAAFLAGLGLGNHLSLLWVIPGLILLLYLSPFRPAFKLTLLGAVLFVAGLSTYLYLPIRSSLAPLFNWGNPDNWERFFWHISGKQYRVWMFNQSLGELAANLKNFMILWLKNPGFYVWWLIIPGIYAMIRGNRKLLAASSAIFILAVYYGINYSIPDIEAYFIPAFLASFVAAGCGISFILQTVLKMIENRIIHRSVVILTASLFLLPLIFNYRDNDKSADTLSYDVADTFLESLRPNAVVLADNWDIYAPSIYLIHNDKIRPDVILINKELLRRSWYYDYLQNLYPGLSASCSASISAIKDQIYLFEHGMKYDGQVIQTAYIDGINAFLLKNYFDNPPYLVQNKPVGDYANIAEGYLRIPEGLAYRLDFSESVEPIDRGLMFSGRILSADTTKLSEREKYSYRLMPQMLYQRGLYLAKNMMFDEALEYFLQALKYENNKPVLYLSLGGTYTGLNRVEDAQIAFQKALALDPGNRIAIENLRRLSIFTPGGPKALTTELNNGN